MDINPKIKPSDENQGKEKKNGIQVVGNAAGRQNQQQKQDPKKNNSKSSQQKKPSTIQKNKAQQEKMKKLGCIERLWQALIQPPNRLQYQLNDLGPQVFIIANTQAKREDFHVVNSRNQKVQCSYFEPFKVSDQPHPAVLYMHGNSSSRLEGISLLCYLLPKGISVVLMDFAGCGISDGDFISLGFFEKFDAQLVIEHVKKKFNICSFGLWGRSMGAATSLMVSSFRDDLDFIVADSPYLSIQKLCIEIARREYKVPLFMAKYAWSYIRKKIQGRGKFDLNECDTLRFLKEGKQKTPILFMSAKDDTLIDYKHTLELYETYNGSKNILLFEGNHNSRRPKYIMEEVAQCFKANLKFPPARLNNTKKSDTQAPKPPQPKLAHQVSIEIQTNSRTENMTDLQNFFNGSMGNYFFLCKNSLHDQQIQQQIYKQQLHQQEQYRQSQKEIQNKMNTIVLNSPHHGKQDHQEDTVYDEEDDEENMNNEDQLNNNNIKILQEDHKDDQNNNEKIKDNTKAQLDDNRDTKEPSQTNSNDCSKNQTKQNFDNSHNKIEIINNNNNNNLISDNNLNTKSQVNIQPEQYDQNNPNNISETDNKIGSRTKLNGISIDTSNLKFKEGEQSENKFTPQPRSKMQLNSMIDITNDKINQNVHQYDEEDGVEVVQVQRSNKEEDSNSYDQVHIDSVTKKKREKKNITQEDEADNDEENQFKKLNIKMEPVSNSKQQTIEQEDNVDYINQDQPIKNNFSCEIANNSGLHQQQSQ